MTTQYESQETEPSRHGLNKTTYNVVEAARILGFGQTALRELIWRNETTLVVIRLGRAVRITRASIEAVLDGRVPLVQEAA